MLRDAALGACIALGAVVLSGYEPVCVLGGGAVKAPLPRLKGLRIGLKLSEANTGWVAGKG